MRSREEVLQDVLSLTPDDQAYVADILQRNLSETLETPPDVAEAWSAEIDRRISAWDRGEATAIDFDQAIEHLRQSIVEQRLKQATR